MINIWWKEKWHQAKPKLTAVLTYKRSHYVGQNQMSDPEYESVLSVIDGSSASRFIKTVQSQLETGMHLKE